MFEEGQTSLPNELVVRGLNTKQALGSSERSKLCSHNNHAYQAAIRVMCEVSK